VAQEALTNVARHSASSRAELILEGDLDRLLLIVRDDGLGLPPGHSPGTGMRGMRERATLIGARLDVRDRPSGSGCEVRLEVPLEATHELPR
jgi:two-component system sensor histidine kinase UhpB